MVKIVLVVVAVIACPAVWITLIVPMIARSRGVPFKLGSLPIDRRDKRLGKRQSFWFAGVLGCLIMVAQLRSMPHRLSSEIIDGLLRLLGLHSDRHVAISAYSKGMRQKVLLAAALLHNPDLILLDEPFSGLDVSSSLILRSLIEELAGRGKVILFSSHELETVERICSHIVILHRGRIVADDSIENLRALMSLSNLEAIFSQLAVEQDTAAISRQIADLIHA